MGSSNQNNLVIINNNTRIRIFYSYSHVDEGFREQLEKHLSMLRREGMITDWHFRKISGGEEWKGEISNHLKKSDIILLLVSADFLSSDYCYDVEMKLAMELHGARKARVIPIILRPVDWSGAPFSKLQAFPKDAKPVTSWSNIDEAFYDIARGIRRVCQELQTTITNGIELPQSDSIISQKLKKYMDKNIFCSRCGIKPGVRTECTGSYYNHDFISEP